MAGSRTRGRLWAALRPNRRALWSVIAVLLAGLLYLSTFQTHINSSLHPFTTDVGEHQNALPRWGLIHHSGYPQWSALGSMFVTIVGLFGVEPAAAVTLWSLLWGLVAVALLVWLAFELGAAGPFAALGALAAGLTTSMWVDASIAELHTMTMALTVATLLLALRFGRSGARRDLLWLTFVFSQGVFHQRAIALLAPAVLLLAWPHLLTPLRMGRRTMALVVGVALLAPLSYLYLPLRVWMGADWVFGSPGTWDGFWALFFFNNAELVVEVEQTAAAWLGRLQTVAAVTAQDLYWPLLLAGWAGLWLATGKDRRTTVRIGLALTLVWLVNLALTVLIWEDRVSDALLAAKLPALLMAGLGLALLLQWLWRRRRPGGAAAALLLIGALALQVRQTRPFVLGITRDRSTQALVHIAARIEPAADGRATTLMMPWGADYWTLTYAQAFEGKLAGLTLVDHNAGPQVILDRGDHLVTLERTFYVFPPAYFEERLGALYLSAVAPGVVEIGREPAVTGESLAADPAAQPSNFDLGNGIRIVATRLAWTGAQEIVVTIYWEAAETPAGDYSVAVHLVAQDPPRGPGDILAQADRTHPVENWYPTSRWRVGEIVRDMYALSVPEDRDPVAVRVAMYQNDPALGFVNSPWLSLPLPPR